MLFGRSAKCVSHRSRLHRGPSGRAGLQTAFPERQPNLKRRISHAKNVQPGSGRFGNRHRGGLGADNSIGTWKVNIAKSKYTPAPIPVKSYTMVRETAPGGVKVTITGERTDGAPINAGYTAKFDGPAAAVSGTGTPYDSMSIKQVNANTYFRRQTDK
jgi:hypothetical protein